MPNKQKSQNSKPKASKQNRIYRSSLRPPPFIATTTFNKVFRFQSNAAFTQAITAQNILDLYVFAVSATIGTRLIESFKLTYVEMWAPPIASLVPQSMYFEYLNDTTSTTSAGGPSIIHSDTTMGADRCAHLRLSPPKSSLASFWQSGTALSPLFYFSGPINTVVDVHLTIVFQDNQAVNPLQNQTTVGATAGQLYVGGLDGKRAATTVFPPTAAATQ